MKTGIELIADERERQVSQEGWTPEHDNEHEECELTEAAVCYALTGREVALQATVCPNPSGWPWDMKSWKPSPDPIRNLVKAGALIAAEIDRLNRAGEA
jgi:hypothetical protein